MKDFYTYVPAQIFFISDVTASILDDNKTTCRFLISFSYVYMHFNCMEAVWPSS